MRAVQRKHTVTYGAAERAQAARVAARASHVHDRAMDELIEIFGAERGLVCCVGAGGKKTTMYRLARIHPGRVGITATAHIERFPRRMQRFAVVADGAALEAEVAALSVRERVTAFAKPCELPGRYLGVTYDELARLRQVGRFDLCVVKADGARNRLIKAPAEHEPALPEAVDTVIPVVSARVLGQPLSERIAHRPERIAGIAGLAVGDLIRPEHLARLFASEQAALKGVGAARVVPLINMVDDAALEASALVAAEHALALCPRFDWIVLAAMKRARPLVRVVRRSPRAAYIWT